MAIDIDKLTWTNVTNLQFWQDPIVENYRINSVPASYLVNQQGVVLAKGLKGVDLIKKIEELLSE